MTVNWRYCGAVCLLLLTGLCGPATVQAEPIDELNALLAQNRSLHARFEQTVQDEEGQLLQQTSGELWAARPNRFRWESAEPFPQVLVSNGSTLWIYDQDLDQVSIRKLDDQLSNTPALLLSGRSDQIQAAFRVESEQRQGERRVFDLLPLDESAPFARLRAVFEGGHIHAIRLQDNLGQHTEIRLLALDANAVIDDERFEFELPPGADVMYQ